MASLAKQSGRPFYGEYAWAFDLLIDRPVGQDGAAITAWLSERGVLPGATILDAGCGTGRYAGELARRGYAVEGVDRSSELIETAKQSVHGLGHSVSFRVGDILALPPARYDGILCRGVLNDFVNDDARLAVFAAFAGALRPAGVLILDVREWEATRDRKRREPVFRRAFLRIEASSRRGILMSFIQQGTRTRVGLADRPTALRPESRCGSLPGRLEGVPTMFREGLGCRSLGARCGCVPVAGASAHTRTAYRSGRRSVHVAGEQASSLRGWMHGAFESGRRVAREIDLAQLAHPSGANASSFTGSPMLIRPPRTTAASSDR
jgi:SAM-dependent methyltransferase